MSKDKNILITGISRGLGLEILKTLLQEDHRVYGVNRTISEELKTILAEYKDRLSFKPIDLAAIDSFKQSIFKDFIGLNTPLHGFVNNAALAYDDIITNLKLPELETMFRVNVFAPFMLTKFVIRNMILNNVKGSIVHISSISVHTGYKGLSMYAASKGALEAFSKNTAREWGEKGIRSNCIAAGFMETQMSAKLSYEQKNRIYSRTALKQPTDKKSVAKAVGFLLSDDSASITGQTIFVDSGTSRRGGP
jgi:3-oxoacyl-[acyl-carrier protein] reductase